ncbi:hypothetical protein IGI04_036094, partial [Brassica rapa subsp. trilocularis]
WLALDRWYIKSHSASLDDHFNPSQFQKSHLPSRIISNLKRSSNLERIKWYQSHSTEFISEFKQMINAKFAPIHKRIDQLETRQKRSVPSHEKSESRRLAAEDWFVDPENKAQGSLLEEEQLDNPTQDSLLVTRRPLNYDFGPIFDEESQPETIEQSDLKETKEAAKEELFKISTKTHFDDIFKRYSHYSRPDPYIICFETLKEVEYGKKKLWAFLGKLNMEEGRVVSSVLNSQSKINEPVEFVFGESALWNPAAKAKALLFEELKPYIKTKFQYKFLDVGCSKNARDDLQYLEVCSFHPKEYDAGNGTQRNHHIIDKVRDGCGVTKLKLLAQLQWLHKGGNVNVISIPPTFPLDPGESDLWTNPFEEEGNDAPQIVQPTSCSLPPWTRLVRMNLDSRQRLQVKRLFLVEPVRHIRQQIMFASLSDL